MSTDAFARLRQLRGSFQRKTIFSSSGEVLLVTVRDNNVDQALKALKRKLQREGVFREMRQRRAYEKPSERRNREKGEAVRRARKAARKAAQREGLLPMPKKKPRPDGRPAAAGAGSDRA
jgi:small subunit ribosomal protein S21